MQFVQDHVIHFYHLHALDWVDVVSALSADPAATSTLQKSISDWPNNSPDYFAVGAGTPADLRQQRPARHLRQRLLGPSRLQAAPEGNLLAVAHYLEALDWQREVIKLQPSWAARIRTPDLPGGRHGDPGRSGQLGCDQRQTRSPAQEPGRAKRWISSSASTTPTCS